MAIVFETLSETAKTEQSTKFIKLIVDGKPTRFKIVAKNYNSNWEVNIYIQTNNYDFAMIADKNDIPDVTHVSYCTSDENRMHGNEYNISKAINFIQKVF
jgi:hypothetical protein